MVYLRTIPTLAKFRGSISCVPTKFEVETECIILWRIGQLDKHRSAEREAAGSHPDQTNTQGLKITEEKLLPL